MSPSIFAGSRMARRVGQKRGDGARISSTGGIKRPIRYQICLKFALPEKDA